MAVGRDSALFKADKTLGTRLCVILSLAWFSLKWSATILNQKEINIGIKTNLLGD